MLPLCRSLQPPLRVTGSETPTRILPPMPLPNDFYWMTRSASWPSDPLTVIACDGVWVVAMSQRVSDDVWIALLDRHQCARWSFPAVHQLRAGTRWL